MRMLVAIALAIFVASPVQAIEPNERLTDPAQEARARTISRELRCLVCQNQSIDDSNAPLARDLRRLVRVRIKAGDSNKQVLAYVHARYGDFVLLRPPVRPGTWLLWFGPAIVLVLAGTVLLVRAMRRRAPAVAPEALTEAEQQRVDALLASDPKERG